LNVSPNEGADNGDPGGLESSIDHWMQSALIVHPVGHLLLDKSCANEREPVRRFLGTPRLLQCLEDPGNRVTHIVHRRNMKVRLKLERPSTVGRVIRNLNPIVESEKCSKIAPSFKISKEDRLDLVPKAMTQALAVFERLLGPPVNARKRHASGFFFHHRRSNPC
jgi:hypothetical protein